MRLDAKARAERNEQMRAAATTGRDAVWISATFGVSLSTVYEVIYGDGGVRPAEPFESAPLSEWEQSLLEQRKSFDHIPAAELVAALEDVERGSWPDQPCVYFIQETDSPFVKIGITTTSRIALRLDGLQTGNPRKLVLRRLVRGGAATELALHLHFAQFHMRGEWFLADGELAEIARAET